MNEQKRIDENAVYGRYLRLFARARTGAVIDNSDVGHSEVEMMAAAALGANDGKGPGAPATRASVIGTIRKMLGE